MLEPVADDPRILVDFHRRQAKLNLEAGDFVAARWHGRQAQRQWRRLVAVECVENQFVSGSFRALVSRAGVVDGSDSDGVVQ